MLLKRSVELTLVAAFAFTFMGCTGTDAEFTEVGHDESEVAHDDHSDHGHGHHGPNGGDIVEVGNEEFHAEVVVDEASHRVDVYILGSDAKTAKPIEATDISLSFKHGDEVEEFKLTAAALDGEPEGQASKFTLTSEEFIEELHEHSEGATLTFTAGEEKLTGTVMHSHGHEGDHDHADGEKHGDHDHGDKHADDARSKAAEAPAKDEAADEKADKPEAAATKVEPAAEDAGEKKE